MALSRLRSIIPDRGPGHAFVPTVHAGLPPLTKELQFAAVTIPTQWLRCGVFTTYKWTNSPAGVYSRTDGRRETDLPRAQPLRGGFTSCANREEVGKLPDHGSSNRGTELGAYVAPRIISEVL